MLRKWLMVSTILALLPVLPASAAPRFVDEKAYMLHSPDELNSWSRDSPWWEAWNVATGYAAAYYMDRTVLEAQSVCIAPAAQHSAAARATWRFRSEYDGIMYIRPVGNIWGQTISFPSTGAGSANAKITFEVTDLTTGAEELSRTTLYSLDAPTFVKDLLSRGKKTEARTVGDDFSGGQPTHRPSDRGG